MTTAQTLIKKAERREALFGVVGLGYVGLPLVIELARAGYKVLGFDILPKVVDGLNAGRSHVKDISDEALQEVLASGRFEATTDLGRLGEPDAISICVPTPLSKFKDPDVSYIQASTESVRRTLRKGQAVILESTTYPGTTRELMLPALESTGLKVGTDFFLSFSPERVDPGNPVYGTRNTPKVIGGITPDCLKVTEALYQPAIDTLVPVSSPEAAELVKILENTFRSVNIGLVNETAIVCDKLGVDVWEVIEAAATKPFGFMKFLPGPGLGGHCIPIDPHYLAWKMRGLNYKTRFIDLAGEVNTEMPMFWVRKVADALNGVSRSVRGSTILILGVAYKRDIDDLRESPALDIIKLLEQQGAHVEFHDPHVASYLEDGKTVHSVPLTAERLKSADCVMVVTDHTAIDYRLVKRHARLVVDTRHVMPRD
ncbi:MAG TPA: nucleotide sugar dehydrogenase [Gemmatimonadales bacterium]|nr:nucleotide sugar dehydrogenase [Gemmatimonadales bacterium]HRZ09756.1 nucleotide sugar dehydrogenase [Gemmatimonadales bacterium]